MSYDIYFEDTEGNTLRLPDDFEQPKGGTYAIGGTTEAWLNITYNYAPFFRSVFGPDGIRSLYGKTGKEVTPDLERAVEILGTDRDQDYWNPTEGNAGAALNGLLQMAKVLPEGIIKGD
jgi:hypothetical protein